MKKALNSLFVVVILLSQCVLAQEEHKPVQETNTPQLLQDKSVPPSVRSVLRDSIVAVGYQDDASSLPNLKTDISGTGFVVAEGGFVLTDYHVIKSRIKDPTGVIWEIIHKDVLIFTDGQYFSADIAGADNDQDLLLLRIREKDRERFHKKAVKMKTTGILDEPDWPIFAYGFVEGGLVLVGEFHHFNGYISEQIRPGKKFEFGVLDHSLAPGFSGAPVIDRKGNCRGILFGHDELRAGFTPASTISEFLKNNLPSAKSSSQEKQSKK